MTEGRNTGFKKILDALEGNGSPKPEFETDDARSYFITRLFIHEEFTEEKNNVENKRSSVFPINKDLNFNQKNERSLSEVLSEVLSKRNYIKVEKIITYLEETGTVTPKEAEKICEKSSATVRRYLKMLVETGYVESQGNTNNLIYKIKE